MTARWIKPAEDWPTPQDPSRFEARLKDGRTVSAWLFWDVTDQGDSICNLEIDGGTFGNLDQVVEYRPLPE